VELFSVSLLFTDSNSSPAETRGFRLVAKPLLFDRQQRDAFEDDRFEITVDDSQLCVPDVRKSRLASPYRPIRPNPPTQATPRRPRPLRARRRHPRRRRPPSDPSPDPRFECPIDLPSTRCIQQEFDRRLSGDRRPALYCSARQLGGPPEVPLPGDVVGIEQLDRRPGLLANPTDFV